MRIKSLLLAMLFMFSFAAFPVLAQDDEEWDDTDVPEFVLSEDEAVSVDWEDTGENEYRDAASIREELESAGTLHIIIRGRFVLAIIKGNVIYIVCRSHPRAICARIRVNF